MEWRFINIYGGYILRKGKVVNRTNHGKTHQRFRVGSGEEYPIYKTKLEAEMNDKEKEEFASDYNDTIKERTRMHNKIHPEDKIYHQNLSYNEIVSFIKKGY